VIRRRAAASLAALLAAAACSRPAALPGASPPSAAPAAASGQRAILPSGAAISVEVAVTDQERAQGLMFRESMPPAAGMVFLFDGLEIRPFWMKNCHFPLDMIYATKDGTVVDVLKNVPPCAPDPAPCNSVVPGAKADTVLEVNAGVADANGAVPGAKLKWVGIPGR
jgi:uncharacterized membrane protein (UPF0127 family)